MAALRVSCGVHAFFLLLALGCAAHRPVSLPPLPDSQVVAARAFVADVANKMPLWDADAIARYERTEIAMVKADIAMAQQSEQRESYLEYVTRLHDDWDALVALDEMLKKESLT